MIIIFGVIYFKYCKTKGGIYHKEEIRELKEYHDKLQSDYVDFAYDQGWEIEGRPDNWTHHKTEKDTTKYTSPFYYDLGWKIHIGVKPRFQMEAIKIITQLQKKYKFNWKHQSYFPMICKNEADNAVFYNIKNCIKKLMKNEYNENIEPDDEIIKKLSIPIKEISVQLNYNEDNMEELSKECMILILDAYNKPNNNFNGIEIIKQLIRNIDKSVSFCNKLEKMYNGRNPIYPYIQEDGLLGNLFGKTFNVINKKQIIFDDNSGIQQTKFIAIYPYDDLTIRTVVDEIIGEFNNFIKKYNAENKTQIEWDDVFMTISSDFEIKKGITARLCEQNDRIVAVPKNTGNTGNDRYYPAIFNKIHKKFDEYLTINKLIIDKDIDGLNKIPNLYEYIEGYQIERRKLYAKCIDCKAIKDDEDNVIIQYSMTTDIYHDKDECVKTTYNFPCSKIREFKLVNEYRNKKCKVYDDKETFNYDFEKIETTNIEKTKQTYTKTEKGLAFANQLIDYIKNTGIMIDKLILDKSLKALAPYPQLIHHVYINTIEYNIFKYVDKQILLYIYVHLCDTNNIYEEEQYEYYEHPFSELYYKYDDDNEKYPSLLLPKRIKYINIVVDIYNVMYCDNNKINISRTYV